MPVHFKEDMLTRLHRVYLVAIVASTALTNAVLLADGATSTDRSFPDARAGIVLDRDSGVPAARGNYVNRNGPTPPSEQLRTDIFEKIVKASVESSALETKAGPRAAVARLVQALELLPEPRDRWTAAVFLLVRVGDIWFRAKEYKVAGKALDDAMYAPGAIGNPFVHLRNGQVQFELGDLQRAGDELSRAYMGGGKAIFTGEDSKFFGLVEKLLQPEPGKSRLE